MAEITIISPTHGSFKVLFDDADFKLVSQYKWCIHKRRKFYAVHSSKNGTIQMHNLIMGAKMIDHKNGNGLDNRRENLRICSNAENLRNRQFQKNNKTGFKGVHYCNRSNRFIAKITINDKIIYLGSSKDASAAAKLYDAGAIKYHKEYAKTNFLI